MDPAKQSAAESASGNQLNRPLPKKKKKSLPNDDLSIADLFKPEALVPKKVPLKRVNSIENTSNCIVAGCEQLARRLNDKDSIYCSKECIENHVRKQIKKVRAIKMQNALKAGERKSISEDDRKVALVNRKSGILLTGSSAIEEAKVLSYVLEHPAFEIHMQVSKPNTNDNATPSGKKNSTNRSISEPDLSSPDCLVLRLETRKLIMDHVDQLSAMLFAKKITATCKENALKDNDEILQQLISLQFKQEDTSETPKKRMRSGLVRVRELTGVSVFDLDFALRMKLIKKLLEVQQQIRTGLENVVDKQKLVDENNDLIHRLTDLPRRIVNESGLKRNENDDSTDESGPLPELQSEVTNLKQAIADLCSKKVKKLEDQMVSLQKEADEQVKKEANELKKKLEEQIAVRTEACLKKELEEKTGSLKEELKKETNEQVKKELDQRIGELESPRSSSRSSGQNEVKMKKDHNFELDLIRWEPNEILFDHPIDNILELFTTNGQKSSEVFTCCGIQWNLVAQIVVKNDLFGQGIKYLSCILAYLGDPEKYECQTYFELRLLSQSSSRVHKVMATHYTFTDLNGFAFPTFISQFDLFNPVSGFVKNGRIKLQIYLRVERLIPINE